jgi:hypothetical protein
MPSNDKSELDITVEFAKEVAKQLPVKQIYDDGLSPAVKQTGQFLIDLAKVVQLALVPIQFAAAYQDRVRSFIDRAVRAVPEGKQIAPPPQILGPVLEGIRYEPSDTPIDKMFQNLLSSSMNSERVTEAHPAFPMIIKQLSSDEAQILYSLKDRSYDYVHCRSFNSSTNLFYGPNQVEVDNFPRSNIHFANNMPFYMQHLDKLGLAGIFQQGNQEPIFTNGKQNGVRVRSKYLLTDFGQAFVQACSPP